MKHSWKHFDKSGLVFILEISFIDFEIWCGTFKHIFYGKIGS